MPSLNRVTLIGHLGKDPETKQFNDSLLCTFSLSTSRKAKDEYVTDWHKITCWGKNADQAAQYSKGDAVFVEGQLIQRQWKDADGNNRQTTEIMAFQVAKLTKKYEPQKGNNTQNSEKNESKTGGEPEPNWF